MPAASSSFPRPEFAARRLAHHALQLQAVGVGETHAIVAFAIGWIVGGRINHSDAMSLQQSVEVIDVSALAEFKGVVVETDIAQPVGALFALGIRLANPQ